MGDSISLKDAEDIKFFNRYSKLPEDIKKKIRDTVTLWDNEE